tara:strand:+ start:416 stop:628 length:213 start_codon:yes stop_codon:yes gene_type:complete
MKLKQIIAIQNIIDNRRIPIDMEEKWEYYSDSREEYVDIMELDMIHAIRIIRKHMGKLNTEEVYNEQSTQ